MNIEAQIVSQIKQKLAKAEQDVVKWSTALAAFQAGPVVRRGRKPKEPVAVEVAPIRRRGRPKATINPPASLSVEAS